MDLQDNSYDCGAYALAFATELAHMKDPALSIFYAKQMRQHIVSSVDSGHILPFPKLRCTETLYCLCRMPDEVVPHQVHFIDDQGIVREYTVDMPQV